MSDFETFLQNKEGSAIGRLLKRVWTSQTVIWISSFFFFFVSFSFLLGNSGGLFSSNIRALQGGQSDRIYLSSITVQQLPWHICIDVISLCRTLRSTKCCCCCCCYHIHWSSSFSSWVWLLCLGFSSDFLFHPFCLEIVNTHLLPFANVNRWACFFSASPPPALLEPDCMLVGVHVNSFLQFSLVCFSFLVWQCHIKFRFSSITEKITLWGFLEMERKRRESHVDCWSVKILFHASYLIPCKYC